MQRHRKAGAAWIGRCGLDAAPERVLVTAGVQHAMEVVFATLLTPGDLVVTESLTYAGLKALANHLHFRLEGLELDEHGLCPDSLERACRAHAPKMLYCLPTIQNPTGSIMPESRRREIAAIATRHALTIVEDGSYAFFVEQDIPLASFAPDRSYYLAGTSKSLVPGLRVGYVLTPPGLAPRFVPSVFATTIMASPITAEVVSEWMADGLADRVVKWKRQEIAARQNIARRILAACALEGDERSPHIFLRLPEPWRAEEFAAQASLRGLAINTAQEFVVGRGPAPHAIRICLGMPSTRETLEAGLDVLAEMLAGEPEPSAPGV